MRLIPGRVCHVGGWVLFEPDSLNAETVLKINQLVFDKMGILRFGEPVYILELVRVLLQKRWGTIFRQEWFWRTEELRRGKVRASG